MASAGKKWLTGCAIGCVVLLGILGLFAAAGFMMVRNTFEGFQQAQESSEADQVHIRVFDDGENRLGKRGGVGVVLAGYQVDRQIKPACGEFVIG